MNKCIIPLIYEKVHKKLHGRVEYMIGNIFNTAKVKGQALFNRNLYREMNEKIYSEYLKSKIAKSMDTVNTTFKTYQSNMNLFLKWFHECDKGYYLLDTKMLDEFPDILDRYMIYCITERGNNKVTVNNKIVTLSSFYIWARKTRKAIFNPVLDVERQQKWRQDKRRNSYFLTIDQIKLIKKTMGENTKKYDLRTRLMFYIFIDSAIRIGELMRLTINNLDIENAVFKDIRQKGGELRDVNISDETRRLLHEYLIWRKQNNITVESLFVTRYNGIYKPMSRETVRARIKEIGKIVGIDDLYPHTLRKTTVNLITKMAGIEKGALIAHHKNTTVTKEHYVKPMTEQEIREQLKELNTLLTHQSTSNITVEEAVNTVNYAS